MKPSNYCEIFPWNSVFKNHEYENSACCIMRYLSKTGDEFRELTFEEYKKAQPNAVEDIFNEVVKYCNNPDTVRLLSKDWDINK